MGAPKLIRRWVACPPETTCLDVSNNTEPGLALSAKLVHVSLVKALRELYFVFGQNQR
jgi:hypothetical protein